MFAYRGNRLHAGMPGGAVDLEALAERHGTPLYVYDLDAVRAACAAYQAALAHRRHLICAAVKANGNLGVLRRLAAWGCGFDVVSGGELERVLRAGASPDRVVFSGVGKTAAEIDAALRAGILLFNVESEPELELLQQRASRLRRRARFGLRVNPDIGATTHPHIATGLREHKFGVAMAQAPALYRRHDRGWLTAAGISFHIGSQILVTAPFRAAVARVEALARQLETNGHRIEYFDAGGGLGIAYRPGQRVPSLAAYARALAGLAPGRCLIVEPGRSLLAAAGILLTRVVYVKQSRAKCFVITDAGSNDLIRPSLYDAYHAIEPVRRRRRPARRVDVVGPICESGDRFAAGRRIEEVRAGELLALRDVGAYGFVLASNYNARPRAAEVGVEGGRARLLRRRETIAEMLAAEIL